MTPMHPLVILADSRRASRCRACGAPIEIATTAARAHEVAFDAPIVLLPRLMAEMEYAHVDSTKTTRHAFTCTRHKGQPT